MPRVLVLAFHFPPTGGAGVQRSAKFVRYLPAFGWEPVVVTGPAVPGRGVPPDASLAADVPPETVVRRVPTPPPPVSTGLRDRAERWLRLPDVFARWWIAGAVEAGAGEEVDVVYASMSPFESGEAAARLADRLGRPWVADLRDPWALDEMHTYLTRVHRRRELARMRRVLASAAAVVMNTEEAARRVRACPELADTPVLAIPNGFDAADFAGPAPERTDAAFRIVHTGALHTELGRRHERAGAVRRLLGGGVPGVDFLARTHVFLLEAVGRLPAGVAERVEVQLAGELSPADAEVAAASPAARALGYLPHAETVALMRSADLLFLPMHDLPPGERATIVPGKTYEYVASGRPILAAVPDGDARDLLARVPTAAVCRPRDVDGIARAIEEAVRRRDAGTRVPPVPPELLAPLERRALTARLAAVFERVTGVRAYPCCPTTTKPRQSPR